MKKQKETNPMYDAWRKQRGDWGNVKPFTRIEQDKRKKKDKHPKHAMDKCAEE